MRIRELADTLELDLHKKIEDCRLATVKKVEIIQGLLHEPRLIILDESSIGLDPLMQQCSLLSCWRPTWHTWGP